MKRLTMKARLLAAAASTLAITVAGGVALAQEDDEAADADGVPAVSAAGCGLSFAQSGAASNVAYAALQLAACDALLAQASSAQELLAAEETIDAAHAALIERWQAVGEELIAAAADPAAPIPPAVPGVPRTVLDAAPPAPVGAPADGEDAAAEAEAADEAEAEAADAEAPAAPATDAWSVKLAERHAVEVAMDGLRLMSRLAYRLSDTYAEPSALAAGLQGPAAARVAEVLSSRQVCVGAGELARGNTPATLPSWYAFAEIEPGSEEGAEPAEPINYEREVPDDVAARAAAYLMTTLASAPELGVPALTSVTLKAECSRPRDWPSDRAPA